MGVVDASGAMDRLMKHLREVASSSKGSFSCQNELEADSEILCRVLESSFNSSLSAAYSPEQVDFLRLILEGLIVCGCFPARETGGDSAGASSCVASAGPSTLSEAGVRSRVPVRLTRLAVKFCLDNLERCLVDNSTGTRLQLEAQSQQKLLLLLETVLLEGKAKERWQTVMKAVREHTSEVPQFSRLAVYDQPSEEQSADFSRAGAPSNYATTRQPSIVDLLALELFPGSRMPANGALLKDDLTNCSGLGRGLDDNGVVYALQDYALGKLRCVPRLLAVCYSLVRSRALVEEEEELLTTPVVDDRHLRSTLALVSRIVKLLDAVVAVHGCPLEDEESRDWVIQLVASLPLLYRRLRWSVSSFSAGPGTSSEEIRNLDASYSQPPLIGLVEDAIHLAQGVMSDDLTLLLNLKLYVAASILESLGEARVFAQQQQGLLQVVGGSCSHVCTLPIACSPQVATHALEMVRELCCHSLPLPITRASGQLLMSKKVPQFILRRTMSSSSAAREYVLHGERFDFRKQRSREERIAVLLPSGGLWLDNWVQLMSMLHMWGMPLGLGLLREAEKAGSEHSEDEVVGVACGDSATVASEDEVWFADLFSETGRQSIGGGSAGDISLQQSTSFRRGLEGSGGGNMWMHAALQLVSFLKDCVFNPDWDLRTCMSACGALSKENIDALLQAYGSCQQVLGISDPSSTGCGVNISRESEQDGDNVRKVIGQFAKGLYSLIFLIMQKGILTDELQLHFINSVLGEVDGDEGQPPPEDMLLLVARLLVRRVRERGMVREEPQSHDEEGPDVLVWAVVEGMISRLQNQWEKVVSAAMEEGQPVDLGRAVLALPSILHMEVMVLAYHSLGSRWRSRALVRVLKVVQRTTETAESSRACHKAEGAAAAVFRLVMARLVLMLRYMVVYFDTFPAWLLSNMQRYLRYSPDETCLPGPGNIYPRPGPRDPIFGSWASIVGASVLEDSDNSEVGVDERKLGMLFEMGDAQDAAASLQSYGAAQLEKVGWSVDSVWNMLCRALQVGRSRAGPQSFLDLLVERYLFHACWEFLLNLPISDGMRGGFMDEAWWCACKGSGMTLLARLGRFVKACILNEEEFDPSTVLACFRGVLFELNSVLIGNNDKVEEWRLLECSAITDCLSRFLQMGCEKIIGQSSALIPTAQSSDHEAICNHDDRKENSLRLGRISESIVSVVADGMQGSEILKSLSSVLVWFKDRTVAAVRSAVESMLVNGGGGNCVALMLLLQAGINRNGLHHLPQKLGEYVRRLLRWDSSTTWDKEVAGLVACKEGCEIGDHGSVRSILLSGPLHGFSPMLNQRSAAVVSCLQVLDSITQAICGWLKVVKKMRTLMDGAKATEGEEWKLKSRILPTLMAFQQNSVFEVVIGSCQGIMSKDDLSVARDVYVLVNIESIFRKLKAVGDDEAVECIVLLCVRLMEEMWGNSMGQKWLSRYFLESSYKEEDEADCKIVSILPLGTGDFTSLFDILEWNKNESVNVHVLRLLSDLLKGVEVWEAGDCGHPHSGMRWKRLAIGFWEIMEKKVMGMDRSRLALWIEERLLGVVSEKVAENSAAVSECRKMASLSVRNATVQFIEVLAKGPSEAVGDLVSMERRERLRRHIFSAMLSRLESAFLSADAASVNPFFQEVVKLAVEAGPVRQVMTVVVGIVKRFVEESTPGDRLEGLQPLLLFLACCLTSCGSGDGRVSGGNVHGTGLGVKSEDGFGGDASHGSEVGMAKAEAPSAPAGGGRHIGIAVGGSGAQWERNVLTAVDCEAISADEEEDDAMSDGEVTSGMDRLDDDDEEEESERALASSVCTFTSSGSNFMEQHWYYCYTCDLTHSKGCCSVCAKVCHRGHKVVYSRLSRFFCDCGASVGRGNGCLALKPRKYVPPPKVPLPPASDGGSVQSRSLPGVPVQSVGGTGRHAGQCSESDSDTEEEEEDALGIIGSEAKNFFGTAFAVPMNPDEAAAIIEDLSRLDVERSILALSRGLISALDLKDRTMRGLEEVEVEWSEDKVLNWKPDVLTLRKAYKAGSLDIKIKTEYPSARELKNQLGSGFLNKSVLSISRRGKLAVGEGDKVAIFDVGQLIGQPCSSVVAFDKAAVKRLSCNAVRFEVVHVEFNALNESYLAVAGFEECQVFTLSSRGEVVDRLAVELALEGGTFIKRVSWVPGSQVKLMVVTNRFVKIYDLSLDSISPVHYVTVLEDTIQDAALIQDMVAGSLVAAVLSNQGLLFVEQLPGKGDGGEEDSGARILTETMRLPERLVTSGKGLSLFYSPFSRLLVVSFTDGQCIIGKVDGHGIGLVDACFIMEKEKDQQGTAGKVIGKGCGLHNWKEMFDGYGLFVCLSSLKGNAAVGVRVGRAGIEAQHLRTGSASVRVDGLAAYRSMSKDRSYVLILNDDGSLQVYSYSPPWACEASVLKEGTVLQAATGSEGELGGRGSSTGDLGEVEQLKRLAAALLNGRGALGLGVPSCPIDFFERTGCITSDVKFRGDALRNSDPEAIKHNLVAEEGYVESASPAGFKIMVFNSNSNLVMVGCRIQVGNSSPSHVPSEVRVFQRTIKLEEGVRRWYDIPFTNAEALLADKDFTLTVGPTFSGSTSPRLDSLDVYARPKDKFGWKEKLEALHEVDVLGLVAGGPSVGAIGGSGGGDGKGGSVGAKHRALIAAASPLEKTVCACLQVLVLYYSAAVSGGQNVTRRPSFKVNVGEPWWSGGSAYSEARQDCLTILEPVLENDRQPLLQASARRVLKALFPAKAVYYQARDAMRLAGLARAIPVIESKAMVGSGGGIWAFQEFGAHMAAIGRIAVKRQMNLGDYLDKNGCEMIWKLFDLFWVLLGVSQVETNDLNSLVFAVVDLLYGYAEYLLSHGSAGDESSADLEPVVRMMRQLLFAQNEAVRAASSLALSSRLLQLTVALPTMLPMEESSVKSHMATDGGESTHSQGLPEEDPSMQSVQYCCDGCSLCPITHSRWHCTVCPDFDLCDACYAAADADLPPPHRRDHPMTALRIDSGEVIEGVDDTPDRPDGGAEEHLSRYSSMEDVSEEGLLQLAAELRMHMNASAPRPEGDGARAGTGGMASRAILSFSSPSNVAPHAGSGEKEGRVKPHDCGDAGLVGDGSVVSAVDSVVSKGKVVREILLKRFVEDMSWMHEHSGVMAIPAMRLVFSLASAASSPLVDNQGMPGLMSIEGKIDLEKLVQLMLGQLDLAVPLQVESRSDFGEVAILMFMFFSLLLRHWRVPATSCSSGHASNKPGVGKEPIGMPRDGGASASDAEVDGAAGISHGGLPWERACAVLRQQELVNYLHSILKRLCSAFKGSMRMLGSDWGAGETSGAGASCGSLLVVRREFAVGSCAPFFSDSYAKSHRENLFKDFFRLMLESVFRLAYGLVRIEKEVGERGISKGSGKSITSRTTSGLCLDGWEEVLCFYINNQQTSFVRRYARRLLVHVCGSKVQYYKVRDMWQLGREVRRLSKIAKKSRGLQDPLSYERRVKLVRCLTMMAEVAASRPCNWQRFCLKQPDTLPFLFDAIYRLGEESVVQAMKLLTLAFYSGQPLHGARGTDEGPVSPKSIMEEKKKKKGGKDKSSGGMGNSSDEAVESGSQDRERAVQDMAQVTELVVREDGKAISQFIDVFLLEYNAASVRSEAQMMLQGAWHHGKTAFRSLLLATLLEKVPSLPAYGQNIGEYTELLKILLQKGSPDGSRVASPQERAIVQACVTDEVLDSLLHALQSQNELLANHPNSRIYNTLRSLVEFDGYYLESEPCRACSSPEVPYSRMKLESLKSETKFTDNRIVVKCVGSFTIQSVTMNVHEARQSKSVKTVNLYYNNRAVSDLSELKNNWGLWKRAKSCHLATGQLELKVEFPIPITACNFMIELDSFYENLQASSLESLQCPRCSRCVTDKHGLCANCHENAYQCRQCRNINYENLDSFLCNECGYSKYGRFEFTFMAKPSFTFESMESDEDMRKGLAAIETESENAHRRYQQLLGIKKPLMKLISSIGDTECGDSSTSPTPISSNHHQQQQPQQQPQQQHNPHHPPHHHHQHLLQIQQQQQQQIHKGDTVQQIYGTLQGSSASFKINRKIAMLGVLYGEKCKLAFESVSKSVQTLLGTRRVLMSYLEKKRGSAATSVPTGPKDLSLRPANKCFGCANTFVGNCLELLQALAEQPKCRQKLIASGTLRELFENNIHQGPKTMRMHARAVLCLFTEGDASAVRELNQLISEKVIYCLEHYRSMDVAACVRDDFQLLAETCVLVDNCWEERRRLVHQLLLRSIEVGARHPVISEHIILPCLQLVAHFCIPAKPAHLVEQSAESSVEDGLHERSLAPLPGAPRRPPPVARVSAEIGDRAISSDGQQLSPSVRGAAVHRPAIDEPKVTSKGPGKGIGPKLQGVSDAREDTTTKESAVHRVRDVSHHNSLARRYWLRWRHKLGVQDDIDIFEQSPWIRELVLSACSQAIRSEVCRLVDVLSAQSERKQFLFLDLMVQLLPLARGAGESAAEYFELLNKMIDRQDTRCYLTVKGCLSRLCELISEEVERIEDQERSYYTDISQGYTLHKLLELLNKFLTVPNIRKWFVKKGLLSQVLEALLAMKGLIVQKTKLTGDCTRLLKDLLENMLQESEENKREFIRACVAGLEKDRNKGRTRLFILEQLCNIISPIKPEPVYYLVLNKAHTQEEFIRGSMNKNPYSSAEIGPLMRDVKNKICRQLELLGLIGDDYGMELLVAGNIISLDLTIRQVYEHVWQKAQSGQPGVSSPFREGTPMTVTYRLQGLDGEATEPMVDSLEDDRGEAQDPEVEFAIAEVMAECGGFKVLLDMMQSLGDGDLRPNEEEVALLLKLLNLCCKIRTNRQALLQLGALRLLLERARKAFVNEHNGDAAENLLLIVESLVEEANESEMSLGEGGSGGMGVGVEAVSAVKMFLEKLSPPSTKSQHQNTDTVARILPYLTYGQVAAMEVLVDHFVPFLDFAKYDKLMVEYDKVMQQQSENPKDEAIAKAAFHHHLALESFVKMTESIKLNPSGEKLKGLVMEKKITVRAIRHLMAAFPGLEPGGQTADYKASPEWAAGVTLPCVPVILGMLRGLSRGHIPTQECIERERLLPLLHALESVSGENDIGARAENLLDTLADETRDGGVLVGSLHSRVACLREATRDEMRRRALRKREELLKDMGMHRELRADGGERIVVKPPAIEGLEEVEEEDAELSCMVCREGYRLRPSDMLGTYCYSKRVNLGSLWGGQNSRSDWIYSTVSHFNIIHFQCHQEAKRADAALKTPKKEWEGAALRNSETLCNNLFPLRGPSVPMASYMRCVDMYWDNLNSLGRAEGGRFRLLVHDLSSLLGRFATGASFSSDSKGGGRESNSMLLPFMVQMGAYLLEQGGITHRRSLRRALNAYVSVAETENGTTVVGFGGSVDHVVASPSKLAAGLGLAGLIPPMTPTPSGRSMEESVPYVLILTLLLMSLEDWQKYRRMFLQRSMQHAYVQARLGKPVLAVSPGPSPASGSATSFSGFAKLLMRPTPKLSGFLGSSGSLQAEEKSSLADGREGDSEGESMDTHRLFQTVHPMLTYIGLVEQMQNFFKQGGRTGGGGQAGQAEVQLEGAGRVKDGAAGIREGCEAPSEGLEPWEMVMRERLKDVSALLGFSREMLEWLEEMQGAEDPQEAFDVMGVLSDAFTGGCTCEQFVRDTVSTMGKATTGRR